MPCSDYIRFVTYQIDPNALVWQGVFQAVIALKYSRGVEPYLLDWIAHDLGWLNEHLPAPQCLGYRETDEAVCWFRPDAAEPIAWVRSLVAVLEEHGTSVRMIHSSQPGKVIYEDRWQIVAAPRPRRAWHRRKQRGRRCIARQAGRCRR